MTNDIDLIQKAVLEAHGGNDEIIETSDFIAGAYFMLQVLQKQKDVKFQNTGNWVDIYEKLTLQRDKPTI